MDIAVGTVVISKAGRDKQSKFLTLSVDNGYAYIADGKTRKVEKPKKKKLIHLQRTNETVDISPDAVTNSQVRRILEKSEQN